MRRAELHINRELVKSSRQYVASVGGLFHFQRYALDHVAELYEIVAHLEAELDLRYRKQ
jgi:hypothetical protein